MSNNKKVLYIGNYKEATGWGYHCRENILALDAVGVDVVPRHISFGDQLSESHPIIKMLEEKDDKDCDVVIQHTLPHLMDYDGRFEKNIAVYLTETDHFRNTCWPQRLNLMDEGWVVNSQMLESSDNSYVNIPLHIVPIPCDPTKYQKSYKPLDIPEIKDKFVFYTICEANRRKNLEALLKAFHLEFKPNEDVSLIIKTNNYNLIKELCDHVKRGLKLYNNDVYHPEVLITDHLSEEDIMRVHATGNCFVSTSHGEAWCIPAFDAMAMGKTPICTYFGGPSDYLVGSGFLVKSYYEPVFDMVNSLPDLYVGNENWVSVNINCLRTSMRYVYSNDVSDISKNGIDNAYKYSYYEVGNKMRELING